MYFRQFFYLFVRTGARYCPYLWPEPDIDRDRIRSCWNGARALFTRKTGE